jgi:hypothetical protein
MSQWQDIAPRPETADLHHRILSAAIRNGHTPRSFRHACLILSIRERADELLGRMHTIGPGVRIGLNAKPEFVWSPRAGAEA